MKISETLTKYLYNSHTTILSNILITNLSSILLTIQDREIEKNTNIPITEELKNLIKDFETGNIKNCIKVANNSIPLFTNDTFKYSGQMILPIFHNDKLDGLIVFYRRYKDFINSSLKYGETIRHFVEEFSDDDFVDKT